MTPRAYWDTFGGLWEEHERNQQILILVWSPHSDDTATVVLHRQQAQSALGPLVGAA